MLLWRCSAERVVSTADVCQDEQLRGQDQQVRCYEDKACQTAASSIRRIKLVKSLKRRSSRGQSSFHHYRRVAVHVADVVGSVVVGWLCETAGQIVLPLTTWVI